MQYRATRRPPWIQAWRYGYDRSWSFSVCRKLVRAYWWTGAIVLGFFALHWLVDALLDLILPLLA